MIKNNILAHKALLDQKLNEHNTFEFVADDPIGIPHRYTQLQDIEIAGFFAAILAWGQRKTIINKCSELLERMDNAPYDFILHHKEDDLKKLLGFKHRTFNDIDTLYFIDFLKRHYRTSNTLESAFTAHLKPTDINVENALIGFKQYFSDSAYYPARTGKHIPSPIKKSACKRLNMYLRWMVRNDNNGVDFGIWKSIKPDQLICPLDVHVERVARYLGIIEREQTDWLTAVELTENLKQLDPIDPVKYDLALFGMGLDNKIQEFMNNKT